MKLNIIAAVTETLTGQLIWSARMRTIEEATMAAHTFLAGSPSTTERPLRLALHKVCPNCRMGGLARGGRKLCATCAGAGTLPA